MLERVKKLSFDVYDVVYYKNEVQVQIFRPSHLSERFKEYDKTKNFQIWLREYNNREFRPNHLRVFIDLNLRVRSRPDLKKDLLLAFDNIFYGKDPEIELNKFEKEKFEHFLNDLTVIGVLAQLFIIEQEYGYHRESNFEPPALFFQGWIREFIDNPREIDNLSMSVCSGQPSLAKYTVLENKKNKKYVKNLSILWYLQDNKNHTNPHPKEWSI